MSSKKKQIIDYDIIGSLAAITTYAGPQYQLLMPDKRCYNRVTSSATVDNKVVLPVFGSSTERWIGDTAGRVNVKRWYGAAGSGAVDDAPAIQAAINFAKFQTTANGGNVRYEVFFPAGIYRILTPINLTNINGIFLRGGSGRYVNAQINGNTGGIIFDFSGCIMGGCEGFTFISDKNDSNPSTIALQVALTEDTNGNQIGGLNCIIRDCAIQMDTNPTFNAGLGTIGILNVRGEEVAYTDMNIKADSPLIYANQRDLSPLGVNFTASSSYCSVIRGSGSMGVSEVAGQISLYSVSALRPAIQLLNANSLRLHGYLVKTGTVGGNETAIGLFGQNDNHRVSGTIEGFSRIATYGVLATNINFDFIVANQTAPTTENFNVTGSQIIDSKAVWSFGNTSEFNNGRIGVYHAPVNGGDSSATGSMQNCEWSCGKWVDNSQFISANILNRTSVGEFNTGQPFSKRNGALVDKKLYLIPLGSVGASGSVTGSVIRFSKADKATKTSGNGGFYQAIIRGIITLGSYASGGNVMVDFESRVLVSQNLNGTLNSADSATVIYNKSLTDPNYLDLLDIVASLDLSGSVGVVNLTVKTAGSGTGEPARANVRTELISDFAVNQAIIFN